VGHFALCQESYSYINPESLTRRERFSAAADEMRWCSCGKREFQVPS
jgi:hypothetical protein